MGEQAPSRGGPKILLVEDDPAAARFAAYVLGDRGGFDVTHVTDPVVATQRVRDEAWDLIVIDLDLPRMNGIELLASLRRIAPGIPVVITTAWVIDRAQAGAPGSQADMILEKPINPQRLILVAAGLIGEPTGTSRSDRASHPPERAP